MEITGRSYATDVKPTPGMLSQARSQQKWSSKKQQKGEAAETEATTPAPAPPKVADAQDPKGWVPVSQTKKQMGVRNYRTYVIIGGKGSGKSSLAHDYSTRYLRKFANAIPAPMGPRVIIHDYSGSKAFEQIMTIEQLGAAYRKYCKAKGMKPMQFEHPLDVLRAKDDKGHPFWKKGRIRYATADDKDIELFHRYVFMYVRNAMVILDECTVYFKSTLPQWQRLLLINHRNKGLEMVYIFHEVRSVPLKFTKSDATHSFDILPTREELNEVEILNRYCCGKEIYEACKRVKDAPRTEFYTQYHELVFT